jgi:outer membrane usher protein FimD/PapC
MNRFRQTAQSSLQALIVLTIPPVLFGETASTAQANATGGKQLATIGVGEPDGFSNLVTPQSALVDVYFGGKRLGDAQVIYEPGSLSFNDPAKLVALLPDLANTSAVEAALAVSSLSTNASLICMPGSDPTICGRLSPQVAGIIFDQQHFRVDVFVSPHLLAVKTAVPQQYLPRPDSGLAIVDAIGAVMSGSSDGSRFYNLQDHLILGDADRRLRSDLSYASGFGVQTDRLVAEIDKPGWRYSAGAFWAPGTDLIGRRKMVGIGIETQIDTRLDKDVMRGNPLVVFLNQRARVDILRDGRVQTSRIYEAGNQTLDTAGLPDGSYEVVLRIEQAGGSQHEERRFFTKNPLIAAVGQKILFAYAGVLADDVRGRFLAPTGTPFFQGGAARRLGPHLALDGTVLVTDKTVLGEIGAYYIAARAQLRIAAVGSSNGDYGGLIQLSTQGNSRFNFNFDLRSIKTNGRTLPLDTEHSIAESGSLFGGEPSTLPLANSSFTQVSGNISYSLPSAQFGVSASYRRERGERARYSIGPSLRWEFLRRGPLRLSFNGDLALTDQGHSGFVGLGLQILGGRSSLGGGIGIRSTALHGEPHRTSLVGGVNGSWQDNNLAGAQLNLGGAYERDINRDEVTATANLRGKKASLLADVIENFGVDGGHTQYSLGFQTSAAFRGGTLAFEGRNQSDSMVVVKVEGAKSSNPFEVIVNDGPVGTVRSGGSLAVALPSYRQYDVRIRPIGGDLIHYDGSARRVGLYPGNVAKLSWIAKPVTALFGRLVLENGQPVATAAIGGTGSIIVTDEHGYFQIETANGDDLVVSLPDGGSCRVSLPLITPVNSYAALGTLTCRRHLPEVQLTSAN